MIYTQRTMPHASLAVHAKMLHAVLSESPTYFLSVSASRLINRFGSDMNIVDFVRLLFFCNYGALSDGAPRPFPLQCSTLRSPWLPSVSAHHYPFQFLLIQPCIVGSLLLVCIATPWLAISVPVLGYVYWTLQKFYLATSRQLQRLESSSKSPLFSAFSTAFTYASPSPKPTGY